MIGNSPYCTWRTEKHWTISLYPQQSAVVPLPQNHPRWNDNFVRLGCLSFFIHLAVLRPLKVAYVVFLQALEKAEAESENLRKLDSVNTEKLDSLEKAAFELSSVGVYSCVFFYSISQLHPQRFVISFPFFSLLCVGSHWKNILSACGGAATKE